MCGEGEYVWQRGACMAGGMCGGGGMHGWGHAWQGACVARGHVWQGGTCMAGETATAADGKHPTGMHSC